MKFLLNIICTLGALLTAAEATHFRYATYTWDKVRAVSADADADGLGDIILIDAGTGHFVTGFGQSGGGFLWETPRAIPLWHQAIFTNDTISCVADLDGDGADDLAICLYHSSRVLVFKGSSNRSRALASMEEYFPGPGPAGIAAAQLDPSSPELELVLPVLALTQPRIVSVLPRPGPAVTTDYGPIDASQVGVTKWKNLVLKRGFGGPSPTFVHVAAWISVQPGSSAGPTEEITFVYGTLTPSGNLPFTAVEFTEPYHDLLAANMRGPIESGQFVLWDGGLDSLVIATVTENTGALAMESLVVPVENIDYVAAIGGPGGLDRIAVVHEGGTRVTVIGWDPALLTFVPQQTLYAPPGRTFAGPVSGLAGGAGGLFAMMSDGGYLTYQFDAAGQLQLTHQGALPQLPAFGGHATVMLYTDDPLSGNAFEFQSFAAGDWASDAAFAGGQIHAVSEIFQSTALGLGSPLGVVLDPFANPGAAAQAQGNQFGDASSSLFFAGGVSKDGNAAVNIAPPPGVYGGAFQVTFAPAQPGTTVVYSVNGQAWQQAGAGGFFLAADALVEYYGQAAGGAPGTIHSAHYDIAPAFAADGNGDYLPDAAAVALGLNPDITDGDGDGVSDINELLNGSDPHSAASQPAALNVTLPPALEISLSVLVPPPAGPLHDAPPAQSRYTMFLADGTPLRSGVDMRNGSAVFTADPALIPSAQADEPGLSDFERGLIVEVELPGTDPEARGASLFGMAFAPGFVLPQLPPGTPSPAEVVAWIADTTAALDEWKPAGLTNAPGPVLINADTTLAVAAFTAWTSQRLADAGVADSAFAWDHRGSREDLPAHELALIMQNRRTLERPANPATPAYELGTVARGFYAALTTGTAYQPLRTAAREMIRRDVDQPVILGRIYNPAQALLHFFDTGELESFYATATTQSPAVLAALRAQLLGLPQPRAVRPGTGFLRSQDGGSTWTLQTAAGEIIALLDDRRIAAATAGGLTFNRLPAQPSDPSGNTIYISTAGGGVWQSAVQAFGFTLPAAEPRPPGTHSAIVLLSLTTLDADLRADLNDTDGDRLDDAFEQQFFNGLDPAFDDDTDGDGFFNGEEYFLLTNPASAVSRPPGVTTAPRNIAVSPAPGGGLCVCWDGRPDTSYAVGESGDLAAWADSIAPPVQTAPGRFQWTNPGTAARLFIQIRTTFE